MRILEVDKCDDPNCPFFKRIHHYDYNDECRCLKSPEFGGRYIHQYEFIETDERDYETDKFIGGEFPEWCPLKKPEVNK